MDVSTVEVVNRDHRSSGSNPLHGTSHWRLSMADSMVGMKPRQPTFPCHCLVSDDEVPSHCLKTTARDRTDHPLASVLSLEDREVLAYMITRSMMMSTLNSSSISANDKKKKNFDTHKPPVFDCGCFDYYTSYWFQWDSSPNRELIHQAIEAFVEHLANGVDNFRTQNKESHQISSEKVNTTTAYHDLLNWVWDEQTHLWVLVLTLIQIKNLESYFLRLSYEDPVIYVFGLCSS
ncbi:uncharacterized protein LOC132277548 [Cornus florida]|uniref:uncharacterized protein LOC132277548 n=1 Tax=Cornus florida TaxID=4283 RepID=UPI00289BC71C|nr:uncharacterized protein LOC132277548 [Cornus florida]